MFPRTNIVFSKWQFKMTSDDKFIEIVDVIGEVPIQIQIPNVNSMRPSDTYASLN